MQDLSPVLAQAVQASAWRGGQMYEDLGSKGPEREVVHFYGPLSAVTIFPCLGSFPSMFSRTHPEGSPTSRA